MSKNLTMSLHIQWCIYILPDLTEISFHKMGSQQINIDHHHNLSKINLKKFFSPVFTKLVVYVIVESYKYNVIN